MATKTAVSSPEPEGYDHYTAAATYRAEHKARTTSVATAMRNVYLRLPASADALTAPIRNFA